MKTNFVLNILKVKQKFLIRVLLFIIISAILPLLKLSFLQFTVYYETFLWYFIYIFLLFESNRFIIIELKKKYPRDIYIFKHLIYQIPSTFAASFVIIVILGFILNDFNLEIINQKIINCILSGLIISIGFVTIFEGSDFFLRWKEYLIRSERIEKENIIAKYEALKEQIHPHFLFNGLNTLIGLIESNDKNAAKYATNLTEFLKYLLTYQNKELISLQEELEVVRQYIYIQQVRFKDNLKIEINIQKECLLKMVPPLAVQMLVENAIKHNTISQKNNLEINIDSIDKNWIKIRNNKQPKAFANSAQVGLKNINNRYSFLSQKSIEVIDDVYDFIVKLPLL